MNVLLILSALKKGWEYTKGFLALALKYWYIVIIALLLAIATSLRNDVNKLNAEKDALNSNMAALVQKQKTDLLEAQKKAQEKEIEILTKQKEVEVNYAKQVKKLSIDVSNANSANARLSDKLSTNANKLSTISKEQADTYTKSLTELSRNCTERYTIMGAIAQEHRIAEERAVSLYNALVDSEDGADNPDTNNKE
jgi:electron transfer flavoprotein alpha subunit